MDEPIYLGFTVIDLCILLLFESYYDNLQPYFGVKKYTIALYGLS